MYITPLKIGRTKFGRPPHLKNKEFLLVAETSIVLSVLLVTVFLLFILSYRRIMKQTTTKTVNALKFLKVRD